MQEDESEDWLVNKLQALIDIAFRMTTGNMEALRPSGLLLLKVGFTFKNPYSSPMYRTSGC